MMTTSARDGITASASTCGDAEPSVPSALRYLSDEPK
jgi:hypothetical protein